MPRYSVTVKRWGDYDVEADTPEEAMRIVAEMARHHSPDSDTYMVEALSARELGDDGRETDADAHAEDVWHVRYDGESHGG